MIVVIAWVPSPRAVAAAGEPCVPGAARVDLASTARPGRPANPGKTPVSYRSGLDRTRAGRRCRGRSPGQQARRAGYRGGAARAGASWRREGMPRFRNTLVRGDSPVEAVA